MVAADLASWTDLLIVNKFGKHEADGRGFRDVISEAIAMDIPVLVGLNALYRQAFEDFVDGLAIQTPPEPASLMSWVEDLTRMASELV